MFAKKEPSNMLFKLTSFKSGTIRYEFELDKKKLLIGSSEKCDIVINDPSISHYHAFITLTDEGGQILDLSSENGIFINHSKVNKGFFSYGDTISLGIIEFHVNEDAEQMITIVDQDFGKVDKISSETLVQVMPELPPREDLVVIDGEYCDIVFNEQDYTPQHSIHAFKQKINKKEYIDTANETEIVPIIQSSDTQSIQVTIMSMGNVLSVDYLPLTPTTYYVSANKHNKKTVLLNTLDSEDNIPFVKVTADHVEVFKLANHECFNLTHSKKINHGDNTAITFPKDEEIVFTQQTVEVHLQYVDTPPHIRTTPFFGRDRQQKIDTAKVFSALMSLVLLLLLIDTSVQEEKKKVAVIYRVAKKTKKLQKQKTAEKNANVDKDNGIKKTKQPNPDKNRFAKKKEKQPKKKIAKSKPKAKKSRKAPKKVAKAKSAPVKKKVKKIKAYKFKMKNTFSSVFAASTSKDTKVNRAPSSSNSHTSLSTAKASSSNLKANNSSAAAVSFGSDYKGSYDRSTGSKGLSSKRGIDTTFMEQKTVVLGSMDPEILRRILQEYLPQFRHCYQQELENFNEGLEGVIDLKFRINKSGRVTRTNIKPKDANFSKKGTNCMAGVLKLIKFPKPKGGGVVDVRQPLNFFSEKQKI